MTLYRYNNDGSVMPGPYSIIYVHTVDTFGTSVCTIKHIGSSEITENVLLEHMRPIEQPTVFIPAVSEQRPSWCETWMSITMNVARRSSDKRLKVGAIVVPEDNTGILALGFNGGPKGLYNEPLSQEPGKSGFTHAEANCLIKCPYHFPLKKHMYVTHSPCVDCSRLIINAGISRVVFAEKYRDLAGLDMMREAGIEVVDLDKANGI